MKHTLSVIPAKAGIHRRNVVTRDDARAMGTRLRGCDGMVR